MSIRLSSTHIFESPLRRPARVILFSLAVGLPCLFIAARTLRIALAAAREDSTSVSELRWALALDPVDPNLHQRLGLVYLYSLEEPNLTEALKHFRRATELNPHKSLHWTDLAVACMSTGDTLCADRAYERALHLNPMTPRLHWIAANHYLQTDRTDTALQHFRRLLELDPGYAWPTFRLCLRALDNPEVIFHKALPVSGDPKVKLFYAAFLAAHGEADFAHQVWVRTITKGPSFSFSSANPFLQSLLDLGRIREAADVWEDLKRLGTVRTPATDQKENLVFNGDFEQVPLNAGFDWRHREGPYVSLDFTDSQTYGGNRCLRLDFTVKRNDEFDVLHQLVPVVPNQQYLLRGYVRSENITSDSGPRLRVADPSCPECLNVSSETTVGTTPWHPLSLSFSTGGQTHLVRLSLGRARSRSFPTEITGRFWLDAVSMKREDSTDEKAGSSQSPSP